MNSQPDQSNQFQHPTPTRQQITPTTQQKHHPVRQNTRHVQNQVHQTNQQQMQQQQQQQQQNQQQTAPQDSNVKRQIESIYNDQHLFKFDVDIKTIAPEIDLMEKLLQYERKIDDLILNKQIDIQEQLLKPFPKLKRILRIHIFNYFSQPQQSEDLNSTGQKNNEWCLRIQGKILSEQKYQQNNDQFFRKFSYFFKQITIIFDNNKYPQEMPEITWKKANMNSETDGFEIKIKQQRDVNVKILFQLYSNPQKFKLDEKLSKLLGISFANRATILSALWEYIKLNRLQDKENRNMINNDYHLKQIFECDSMQMDSITFKLKDLLQPQDPIEINHFMKFSNDFDNEKFFDLQVEFDYPLNFDIMPFLGGKLINDEKQIKNFQDNQFFALSQKLKKLEKRKCEFIEQVQKHYYKRNCYAAYERNPSLFIENTILQQNNFLKIMKENTSLKSQFEEALDPNFLLQNEELIEKEIRNYFKSANKNKMEEEKQLINSQ